MKLVCYAAIVAGAGLFLLGAAQVFQELRRTLFYDGSLDRVGYAVAFSVPNSALASMAGGAILAACGVILLSQARLQPPKE